MGVTGSGRQDEVAVEVPHASVDSARKYPVLSDCGAIGRDGWSVKPARKDGGQLHFLPGREEHFYDSPGVCKTAATLAAP